MSATKPEQDVYSFDSEPISPEFVETLREYAGKTGIDLVGASEQAFRLIPESLSKQQGFILLEMLLRAYAEQRAKRHRHWCVECGDSIPCTRPGCIESEGMCWPCRKGDYNPPTVSHSKRILKPPRVQHRYHFKNRGGA